MRPNKLAQRPCPLLPAPALEGQRRLARSPAKHRSRRCLAYVSPRPQHRLHQPSRLLCPSWYQPRKSPVFCGSYLDSVCHRNLLRTMPDQRRDLPCLRFVWAASRDDALGHLRGSKRWLNRHRVFHAVRRRVRQAVPRMRQALPAVAAAALRIAKAAHQPPGRELQRLQGRRQTRFPYDWISPASCHPALRGSPSSKPPAWSSRVQC